MLRRGVSFDTRRADALHSPRYGRAASECGCQQITCEREKDKHFIIATDEKRQFLARRNRYNWARRAMLITAVLLSQNAVSSLVFSLSSPVREGMKRRKLLVRDGLQHTSFRNPRVLQIIDDSDFKTVLNLIHHEYRESSHQIHVTNRARKREKNLENSEKYNHWRKDPARDGSCEPMQSWQETSFPTCTKMHEVDMASQLEALTYGGYNSVFKMTDIDGSTHIVKILESEQDFTDRNFDRVRRDALIMERASSSDYVIDIYSFCGFSEIVQYGQHGNLDEILDQKYDELSQHQKLQIATQVAQALADIHDIDGTGISSFSHGDFASKQYILIDGLFKLNDFNRGRLIRWNSKLQEPCGYTMGYNDGKFRSPEEYSYSSETAAIDVWALGSILVELVSGESAWEGYDHNNAQREIVKGNFPPFHQYIEDPSDPINQVLLKAIDMCYVYEAARRPKAGAVLEYLKNESKRLGIHWNDPFPIN